MTATMVAACIRAEVRELQKASAVLACIQCAAEYENQDAGELAESVAVDRAIVTAASARIDAALVNDSKAETEGEGPN